MSLVIRLSVLAVHQVLGDRATSLFSFLEGQFSDQASRLDEALHRASDRAWRALELAAAGDSWWSACQGMFTPADEKALRRQVRAFLDSLPPTALPGESADFCRRVVAELKAARRVKLIPGGKASCKDVAGQLAGHDQDQQARREQAEVAELIGTLRREGYADLAMFVGLRPQGGPPLLVAAVRYFFRREIEDDPKLAAGLTSDRLEGLASGQKAGFDGLFEALSAQGGRLEEMLDTVGTQVALTREAAEDARDGVASMREDMRRMEALLQRLMEQRAPALAAPPPPAAPPTPVSVSPIVTERHAPVSGTSPTVVATTEEVPDWEQVRRLLKRGRAAPELAGEVARLEQTARACGLGKPRPVTGLPVYPADQPTSSPAQSLPAGGKKPLISALFREEPAAEAPVEEAPAISRRRLLSPLFDPPPPSE